MECGLFVRDNAVCGCFFLHARVYMGGVGHLQVAKILIKADGDSQRMLAYSQSS